MSKRMRIVAGFGVLAALAGGSTAAFGLPWDLDMVDSQAFKGYEHKMEPLPEGVVSQQNLISPKYYVPSYPVPSAETAALFSPLPNTPETIAKGEKFYHIYCTPCHGDGVNLGPVAAPGRVPAVAVLSGPDGRLNRLTDGWVYMTIRHGSISKIMPAYGYTMTESEVWSIVHYLRTLDNGAYVPPAPTEPAAPVDGAVQP